MARRPCIVLAIALLAGSLWPTAGARCKPIRPLDLLPQTSIGPDETLTETAPADAEAPAPTPDDLLVEHLERIAAEQASQSRISDPFGQWSDNSPLLGPGPRGLNGPNLTQNRDWAGVHEPGSRAPGRTTAERGLVSGLEQALRGLSSDPADLLGGARSGPVKLSQRSEYMATLADAFSDLSGDGAEPGPVRQAVALSEGASREVLLSEDDVLDNIGINLAHEFADLPVDETTLMLIRKASEELLRARNRLRDELGTSLGGSFGTTMGGALLTSNSGSYFYGRLDASSSRASPPATPAQRTLLSLVAIIGGFVLDLLLAPLTLPVACMLVICWIIWRVGRAREHRGTSL